MNRNWILVADSSRARIFECDRRWRDLQLLHEEDYPRGRAHEGDLVTDNGAEVMQSAGSGQRRTTGPEVSASEHESELFARALADRMREGRLEGEYESLVMVAAPEFLGQLRTALDDHTRRSVSHEIDKNLTQHTPEETAEILDKAINGD